MSREREIVRPSRRRREEISYPRTVAGVVEQALKHGIPADAEIVTDLGYDDEQLIFFQWYEPVEDAVVESPLPVSIVARPAGKHHRP